jgi:putative transposase
LLKAIENPYPFQVLVTDFTWLYFQEGKERLAMVAYVDYGSKILLGYALGKAQDSPLVLKAWDKTKKGLAKRGIDPEKVIVHQDRGGPFVSFEYVGQLVVKDQVMLSYAAPGQPGENAAKESFIGHFKKENKSLFLEAKTEKELKGIVKDRIKYYNTKRRHENLGYLSPEDYLKSLEKR